MCKLTTQVEVELTLSDITNALTAMREDGELNSDYARSEIFDALSPNREDILQLLTLEHEKDEQCRHCQPYWTDEEKNKILLTLFNPRGILSRGQVATEIMEVLMRL